MLMARCRSWTSVFACVAVLLALLFAIPARADSWLPPSTATVQSPDGTFRLTVEPSPIDSQLDYFTEELEAVREGQAVERPVPMALFERRNASGAYEAVWAKPLVNPIAPVEFMIAVDGSRIVTFDNWHSAGHGEHVIVIYDGSGELIRSMTLSDLLPQEFIEALPHSVSSIHWRAGERFSDDRSRLLLDIVIPATGNAEQETVERAIDLRDGSVIPPTGELWTNAIGRANDVMAMRKAAEAERIAYLSKPLLAPTEANERNWHEYLREAFLRLTPNYLDGPSTATKVLLDPSNKRFGQSMGWVIDAFRDDMEFPGNIAIASPGSADALIEALGRAADAVPENSLKESTIYVSVPAGHRAAAERQINRTGATFVWLDPNRAIQQRPERVPGSATEAAANEERMRRQEEELNSLLSELGDF